jgi:hypothetical protein
MTRREAMRRRRRAVTLTPDGGAGLWLLAFVLLVLLALASMGGR